MTRQCWWLLVGVLYAALACIGRPARAEPLPLSLEWHSPDDCPQADDISAELQRLARPRQGQALAALQVRGQIEQVGSDYVLRLETTTRGERGTTVLRAARCNDLQRAATLVIVLVFGDAVELVENDSAAAVPAAGSAAPPPAPAPAPRALPDTIAISRSSPVLRARVEAGAVLSQGLLPTLAVGPRLGVLLDRHAWQLRAAGTFVLAETARLDDHVSASFWSGSLLVAGCYRAADFRVAAGVCLGGVVGTLHGAGRGAVRNRSAFAPWYALNAGIFASYRQAPALEWLLNVSADIAPAPPRFAVEESAASFRTARVVPTLALTAALL